MYQEVLQENVGWIDEIVRAAKPRRKPVVFTALHDRDLAAGFGAVWLPDALARKYPSAPRAWGWQYVFPANRISIDPRSGVMRRHHLDERLVQRAFAAARKGAGVAKAGGVHALRHSFATPARGRVRHPDDP